MQLLITNPRVRSSLILIVFLKLFRKGRLLLVKFISFKLLVSLMEKGYLIFLVMLVIFISGCISQLELPNAEEIENISSVRFSDDGTHPELEENYSFSLYGRNITQVGLKEEAFKKIMKTARKVSENYPILQKWSYVLKYSGSFIVKNKRYHFNLFMGGIGTIVEEGVERKKITPDLPGVERDRDKGNRIFFVYSLDLNDTLQYNTENNVRIDLSGERYIPKGMTNEQETLALLQNKYFENENISLTVRFINMGKEIKILNVFEPVPVFFSIHIKREDGTPILIPGGGKISFMEDSLDYVTLEGFGDQHYVTLELGDILPNGLEAGIYTVSVEYYNQYGDDCFKGILESDQITLTVEEKTPEEIIFEETYRKYIDNSTYCEKETDCICMIGSGLPFLGCSNFLYPGLGGSFQCTRNSLHSWPSSSEPRCGCVSGTCQVVSG